MDALPTRLCRSGSSLSATVGQQSPPGSSGGEPRIEERQVVIGDLPTRYLTAGAGPTLLLVHGDGESAAGWRCVMPALARTHRVVAPSLPGHGDTAKPDTDHSPVYLAEFVHRFIETLNLGPTAVLGNSLGGAVAARHALANPHRVEAGDMNATVVYPLTATEHVLAAAKACAGESLPEQLTLESPLVTEENVDRFKATTF